MRISSPNVSAPSKRPPVLTDPVRYPQHAAAPVRTKRAFLLLVMTLFLPGSAQVAAGNRKLGRRALAVTLTVWAAAVVAIVLALVNREALLTVLTNPFLSIFVIIVLILLAIGWAILFADTLRIVRPGLLAPGMRGVVAGTLAVLVVLTSGTLGASAWLINSGRNAIGSIFAAGPDMKPVDGRYNFLIMGGDAGAGRTGRRPDSIMVVSVDAASGKATTISIPRNFQPAIVPPSSPLHKYYPDGFVCPDDPTNGCILNAFYSDVATKHADAFPGAADPGAEGMMDAASGILGIDIQGYVLVDMAGFSQLIDDLGGVKINAGGWVPLSGADIGNDQHAPPSDWIAPGEQTLNGDRALWYSRSREWVTDYDRSARQQCIMQALVKQMDPATVLSKFDAIASTGSKVIESNISNTQIGSFLSLALKTKANPVTKYTIGPPYFTKEFVVSPDYDVIHQSVKDLLAGKVDSPATGTAAPPAGQAPAGGTAGTAAPGADTGSATAPAGGSAGTPAAPPAPDPAITKDYLQRLAVAGDAATLETLLANNGNCTPG